MKRNRLTTVAVVTIAGAATLVAGCQSGDGAAAHTPTASKGTASTGTPAVDQVAPADDSTQSASASGARPKRTKPPAQYSATAREAQLKRVTGDRSRSAVVQVSSGVYEAASWDAKGNVWFWRTAGQGWHKIGSSRYPTLPGPGGGRTKIASTILPGMQHAMYLADGVFTGDSSGNDIAFAASPAGRWGTVAPQGDSLVPTGKPATDNTTPGIWRAARFTGGKLRTTVGNPFTANATASTYPLITDWSWRQSGTFVRSSSNAFTSQVVAAPNPAAATPLTGCPTAMQDGTYLGRVRASLPAGDVPYSTVTVRFRSSKGTDFCTVRVPANTPVTTPATTSAGAGWVTVPTWMLWTTFQPGAGTTTVYPDQVRAGESPLIAPTLRSLRPDLGNADDTSIAAQVVVTGGRITGIELAQGRA